LEQILLLLLLSYLLLSSSSSYRSVWPTWPANLPGKVIVNFWVSYWWLW